MERLQTALWHKAVLSFSSHLMHLLWWRGRCIFWGGSMPPRLGRGCINRLPVKFSSNSSSTNFHFFSRSCTKVRWNKPATLRRHTGQAHSFSTPSWGTIWGLLGGNKKLRSWRLKTQINIDYGWILRLYDSWGPPIFRRIKAQTWILISTSPSPIFQNVPVGHVT